MAKRIVLSLAIVLAAVTMTACSEDDVTPFACTDAIGCVTIGPDEPIKLGVIQDMSGSSDFHGQDQVRAIELALAHRENELLGHPIEFQVEDEQCVFEGGKVAAEKFASDPAVVAVLGTTCSSAGAAASRVISEAGLVMVSGANGGASLTSTGGQRGLDWQPGYFRSMYNGELTGEAAAVFAFRELGLITGAIINAGDPYTRGLADRFKQVFTDQGGEIVLSATINEGDLDMRPVLSAVAGSGADILFIPILPPEGQFIILQIDEVDGLEDIVILGSEPLVVEKFVETVGENAIGMYFIDTAPLEGAAINELAAEYESRYGEPHESTTFGFGYDAANLVLEAIETVAIQQEDGTLHIGREALREVLYTTSDFQGVTGILTCDEFGDCSAVKFTVLRLDDPNAGLEGLVSNVIYTYIPGE